jgi:uncharacterized protein YjbI with pentapeptide repeats
MRDGSLRDRLERHELWQASGGATGEQLVELGLDFTGLNLDGRNLANALIPGARLRGMRLRNVDLFGANLGGADLSDTTLINVVLAKANLDNADLRNVKAIGGSWFRATCADALLEGLAFSGTNLALTYPDLTPRAVR